jgi:C4-dicarboxylate transporter, DctQ subunit
MFLRVLDKLEEIIIGTLIAAATLLIFVAVLQRYGLSHLASLAGWARETGSDGVFAFAKWAFHTLNAIRLTWAQELAMFMIVWMAKFGAAYGVRTGIHVGVDILVERLSPPHRRICILGALLAGAFFTATIGIIGTRLVIHLTAMGQTSAVLEVPMWLVYLAIPAGSFLMCFRFLQVAWRFAATGALPKHDPGRIEGLSAPSGGVTK